MTSIWMVKAAGGGWNPKSYSSETESQVVRCDVKGC